jgi:Uncharacterized Fe-S center protein
MKKLLLSIAVLFTALSGFSFSSSAQLKPVKKDSLAIVYFIREVTPENVLKLYKALGVNYKGKTGVKIHFGEDGNPNFLNPELTRPLMKATNATWVETNVLYVGKRRFTASHLALAKQHGFTFAPIEILDDKGTKDISTEGLGFKYFKNVRLGKGIDDFDNYIIYTHFKGHGSAGFGGAIKNLAMGFASPGGKMAQHASDYPAVAHPEKCVKCHRCADNCPAGAISYDDAGVHIDTTKCIGCAMCTAQCPLHLIEPKFHQMQGNEFLEKLVEYACMAQRERPMVFINVLANIAPDCDCGGADTGKPFTKDIGIVASKDIVAIDRACNDLVAKQMNCKDAFEKESGQSGLGQLQYAEKLGMGTQKYKLVEIK